MAIDTPTTLTEDLDTGNNNTPTTASITPAANKLILPCFSFQDANSEPIVTSVIGNGITYVLVGSSYYDQAGQQGKTFIYRGMSASPSAGTIVMTVENGVGCEWSVIEIGGIDTGGTNGSAAIVQVVNAESAGDVTSHSVTLAAFGSDGNGTLVAWGQDDENAMTPVAGMTKIAEQLNTVDHDALAITIKTTKVLVPSISWTGLAQSGGVAIEIKQAAAGEDAEIISSRGRLAYSRP